MSTSKRLAALRDGGGWRMHGRGAAHGTGAHSGVGYRYLHTALDGCSRVVHSEILDETAETAADFWPRAVAALAA